MRYKEDGAGQVQPHSGDIGKFAGDRGRLPIVLYGNRGGYRLARVNGTFVEQ
jgi:hypothetical protein